MKPKFSFEDKSAQFLDELEKQQRPVLLKIGRVTNERQQQDVKVVSGRLKKSFKRKVKKIDDNWVLTTGSTSSFAHLNEWGSVHQKGRHTVEKSLEGIEDIYSDEIVARANKIKAI